MMRRPRSTTFRTTTLAAAILATSACSSSAVDDAVDEAEESGESVSEQVDESADQVDDAAGDLATVLAENGLENLASVFEEIDVSSLVGTDEFTFLAPDDEAFQSLEADEIADVLTDPEQLDDVLRRHVVGETIDAAALAELDSIETEGGTTLEVSVADDVITVGDATVTTTDIQVDNGVVHIVDAIFIDA